MSFKSLYLCVIRSRDFADKMEEARLAREERWERKMKTVHAHVSAESMGKTPERTVSA